MHRVPGCNNVSPRPRSGCSFTFIRAAISRDPLDRSPRDELKREGQKGLSRNDKTLAKKYCYALLTRPLSISSIRELFGKKKWQTRYAFRTLSLPRSPTAKRNTSFNYPDNRSNKFTEDNGDTSFWNHKRSASRTSSSGSSRHSRPVSLCLHRRFFLIGLNRTWKTAAARPGSRSSLAIKSWSKILLRVINAPIKPSSAIVCFQGGRK